MGVGKHSFANKIEFSKNSFFSNELKWIKIEIENRVLKFQKIFSWLGKKIRVQNWNKTLI